MLIKTHPPMTVLYSSHQTTLPELVNYVGTAVKVLYKQAAGLDLLVCGPTYWFYYGMDGLPETRFTLEVVLPVQQGVRVFPPPYVKELPPFKCLSARHEGPWEGLPSVYGQMMQYISENELVMNEIFSEAYLHIDLSTPGNNITEVQIGLL